MAPADIAISCADETAIHRDRVQLRRAAGGDIAAVDGIHQAGVDGDSGALGQAAIRGVQDAVDGASRSAAADDGSLAAAAGRADSDADAIGIAAVIAAEIVGLILTDDHWGRLRIRRLLPGDHDAAAQHDCPAQRPARRPRQAAGHEGRADFL